MGAAVADASRLTVVSVEPGDGLAAVAVVELGADATASPTELDGAGVGGVIPGAAAGQLQAPLLPGKPPVVSSVKLGPGCD